MSIHTEPRTKRPYLKLRDEEGRQSTVTVNEKNLMKYGIPFQPGRLITTNHAQALEDAIFNEGIRASYQQIQQIERLSNEVNLSAAIEEYLGTRPLKNISRPRAALRHLLKVSGDILLECFGRKEADIFVKMIKDNTEFSPSTKHDYVIEIKRFGNWLVGVGYTRNNPANGIKAPPDKPPLDYLNHNQIEELIELSQNDEIEPLIIGYLNTGCRPAELWKLEWHHFNFEENKIHIEGTKTPQADRWVPLFGEFKRYVNKMPRKNEYVFTTGNGMPLNKNRMSAILKGFKRKNLASFLWDLRKLRRTYGSILLLNGVPIETVSRFLGHRSIETTEKWYVHLTTEDLFKTVPKDFAGLVLINK